MRNYIFFAACILTAGCLSFNGTGETADYNRMATALRRLGAAVESILWEQIPPPADEALISLACQKDPSLCTHFGKNTLFAKNIDGHAILLLCTPNGQHAIIEDIACTPEPDRKLWATPQACAFGVSPENVREACH
jgi:hypothetical protein